MKEEDNTANPHVALSPLLHPPFNLHAASDLGPEEGGSAGR